MVPQAHREQQPDVMTRPLRRPTCVERRLLHDGWTLQLSEAGAGTPSEHTDIEVAATVPGCVHTDLLSAGLIDDPDVGTAEDDQHWIARSAWRYSTSFVWDRDEGGHVDLVCEGLDTVAQVRLNGQLVAETHNMHRTYRFPVGDLLLGGENHLEIRFTSVYDQAEAVRREVGELPAGYPTPYPYVRKMACNFGWDWGPQLTTAGIWRPISLESWADARIAAVRPRTTLTDGTGEVEAHVELEAATETDLRLRATIAGRSVITDVTADGGVVAVEVPAVQRWWPVGLGEPRLYDLEVELVGADDEVLDARSCRIGFRTVEIAEEPDELGSRWTLVINGQRVPARGYNWIPDDVFPTEVDRARYERRIDQAVAGNANILRVWGGGIYEADDFYDVCDERGILVWQDFLFACAAYPETDDYVLEVEAEARDVVSRLASHPSLVLWNANNESTWGYHDWGWQEVLQGRPWGARYYAEILPSVVAELDPTRPYLIGSPSSGSLEADPNDDRVGVQHLWDVWNEVDYVHYRDHPSSFVAEMGWCAPPTWATLRRGVPEGELSPSNPVVEHHQRAEDGLMKLSRGLAAHFPPIDDPDDWHFLLQVVQARSQQLGADHLRSLERCSGVIVWQLNDCWPVMSWAAVDGDERCKPLWYALRDAFAPRRATVQPDGDGLAVVLIDDEREPWVTSIRVRRVDVDGEVMEDTTLELSCQPFDVAWNRLDEALSQPGAPARELLVVDVDGARSTWFWAEDRDLDYPPAAFDAEVAVGEDAMYVTVTARSLLREVSLFPDRLTVDGVPVGPEVTVDSLLVTLLPGESHTFTVHGASPEHADALCSVPVLRCVNDVAALVDRGG